ncbi:MAG: hypothetical protein KAJ49_09285, partial [Arcobacteraceae bacterium]|nr:hypothetical protein [Arcobacteraceae bacterium]
YTFGIDNNYTAINIDYTDANNIATKRVGLFPINENDIDIIKVNVKVGVLSLNIDVGVDINCTIYDDNNQTINSILSDGLNSNIIDFNTNVLGGNYYIYLKPIVSNTQTSEEYTVNISLYKDAQANTINVASLIDLNEKITGDIINKYDDDVFKLFISSAGKLKVSSEQPLLITKLYKNKIDLDISSTGNLVDDNLTFNITQSGYYFIELSANQDDYLYTFTASFKEDSIKEYRDNNKPSLKLLYTNDNIDAHSVALNTDTLYFGTSTNISQNNINTIIDQISSISVNYQVNDIEVIGDYAYAVFSDGSISKYKTTPLTLIDSLDLNSSLSKIIVDGNYAYTFIGTKLYTIDVSANTLVIKNEFDNGETIKDIALEYSQWNKENIVEKTRNGYIYIANQNDSELRVYSIEDNKLFDDSKISDSTFQTFNNDDSAISKLLIDNNILYATRDNKLKIYDISVPVYASLLGEVYIGNSSEVTNITIDSNHIYLSPNLRVIDVNDKTKPKLVNQNTSLGENNIAIRDDITYNVDGNKVDLYEVRYDYGDTNITSKEISINETIKGNISDITAKFQIKDIDYFKFNTTTSGLLDINLSSKSSNLTCLFKSSIDSNFKICSSHEISTKDINGTDITYYIKVEGINTNDSSDYNLS